MGPRGSHDFIACGNFRHAINERFPWVADSTDQCNMKTGCGE
jgi:hypothetical protein